MSYGTTLRSSLLTPQQNRFINEKNVSKATHQDIKVIYIVVQWV